MQKIIEIKEGQPGNPEYRMASAVSLTIYDGEQIAVVGDNAAGKTRLVDLLSGRTPVKGCAISYDFTPSELEFVSQNIKYIAFRDTYGSADDHYYYQKRWNRGDIDLEFDSELITMSSGEIRKYRIGKALESMPRVLILDNPFIGLDEPSRKEFSDLLGKLCRSRKILIIIVLSKFDVLPDFITHVIEVRNLEVGPKVPAEEFIRRQAPALPELGKGKLEKIAGFPYRDLGKVPFYPQTSGSEIINCHSVTIKYGERTILDNLDWVVHEGERWSLTGANGSGKSTLLSLVCADNPQSYACNIELFGHRRGSGESIWDIKKHIGYVSPEMHRAYLKNIPVLDIVASGLFDTVGLFMHPTEEQYSLCREWMDIFGIGNLAERSYLRISSGEQRLCLLARAFVKDPELLILDEPMHGLDLRQCHLAKQIIDAFVQRPHKTLVMVTHYRSELPGCIDRSLDLSRR